MGAVFLLLSAEKGNHQVTLGMFSRGQEHSHSEEPSRLCVCACMCAGVCTLSCQMPHLSGSLHPDHLSSSPLRAFHKSCRLRSGQRAWRMHPGTRWNSKILGSGPKWFEEETLVLYMLITTITSINLGNIKIYGSSWLVCKYQVPI